jgi:hypothetical protein
VPPTRRRWHRRSGVRDRPPQAAASAADSSTGRTGRG